MVVDNHSLTFTIIPSIVLKRVSSLQNGGHFSQKPPMQFTSFFQCVGALFRSALEKYEQNLPSVCVGGRGGNFG